MSIAKNLVLTIAACAVSSLAFADITPNAFESCRFVDDDVSYEFSVKYAGKSSDESFMVEKGPGWRIEHFAPAEAFNDLKTWLTKSANGLWQTDNVAKIYLECSEGGSLAYLPSSDGNKGLLRDLRAFFNSYTMSVRPAFTRTYPSFHGGGPEERLKFERPEVVDVSYEFYRYMFRQRHEHRTSTDDRIAKNRYQREKELKNQNPEAFMTGGSYTGSNSFIGRIPGETKMTVVQTGATMREPIFLDCHVTVHEDYRITCECSDRWRSKSGKPFGLMP